MSRFARPWARTQLPDGAAFGPGDCLIGEVIDGHAGRDEHVVLMRGQLRGERRQLLLYPYPRRGEAATRPERAGFPIRPAPGQAARTPEEEAAQAAMRRMNEVLARVQEVEEALDDPTELWPRLRRAWARAEDEADPRMAEIVRQADQVQPRVRAFATRLRRVLRRARERIPLSRVQELDRTAMLWLARQPGRSLLERAGASQRILATVRQENFDTLENRVLHAYARLAASVAGDWLREHPRANTTQRYAAVHGYRRFCRGFADDLGRLGIGVAPASVTPNYVLLQDANYRAVHEAWVRLLSRQRAIDDLWAWQAQTWTDFAVLAIVLALDGMEEARLIAQSPIDMRAEAADGRWFDQDRPVAVFWLRRTGRVVEVLSRPETPGELQVLARAHVSLRITDPDRDAFPRRVAVWTPHAIERLDLDASVREAAALLDQVQRVQAPEILRNGLILAPAHDMVETRHALHSRVRVDGIMLDASGPALRDGLAALSAFLRGPIYRDAA